MRKVVPALFLSVFALTSAFADGIEVSDILTVYNPAGAIDTQLTLSQDGSVSCITGTYTCGNNADSTLGTEDPNAIYWITVPVDPNQFGNYTLVFDDATLSFESDVFGIATPDGKNYVLAFTSDSDNGQPLPYPLGLGELTAIEGASISATLYLNPDLQSSGWTATFFSEAEAPEPGTLALFGAGALLLGIVRRSIR